jgi:proline dehydrogenase
MSMATQQQPAHLLALVERLLDEAKDERAVMEARLKTKYIEAKLEKAEMQAQIDRLRERLEPPPPPRISKEQLVALQSRLETLHTAELLTEAELDGFEDTIMDFIEAEASATTAGEHARHAAAGKLSKLVAVSEAVTTDNMFARQARRRFL